MPQPLAGLRILVTRAAHQAGKLSAGLRALGAEPVEVTLLEFQPPRSFEPLDRALRSLAGYDWLLFTSANTVRAVAGRARELGIPLTSIPGRIAAVGAATAEALAKEGLNVSLVPERYVAEGLVESLSAMGRLTEQRILLARAEIARDVIPDSLRAAGAHVDVVDAYRNTLPANAAELLHAALAQPVAAALFTSSSTVEHLAEAARQAGLPFPLPDVAAISIGPITSQTLCDFGWPPSAEANPHDIPGLLQALARSFRPRADAPA
jgi:uroporphyrinogen-III synthase/uroporphyrinogen III methyltransferase/synthase